MRGHGAHMWMCAAVIAVALAVGLISGSGFAFVPVVGCILMMAAMMWMMGGARGRGDRE